MFEYEATLDRVIDGDTVDLNIDLGFGIWKHSTRIRLVRIDTPEKRTRDLLEKHFGYLATDFVTDKLNTASKIVVRTTIDSKDKYGRILGDIFVNGNSYSINDQLISHRLAVFYEGRNKSTIAEAHINNYKYLVESKEVILPADIQELYNQL